MVLCTRNYQLLIYKINFFFCNMLWYFQQFMLKKWKIHWIKRKNEKISRQVKYDTFKVVNLPCYAVHVHFFVSAITLCVRSCYYCKQEVTREYSNIISVVCLCYSVHTVILWHQYRYLAYIHNLLPRKKIGVSTSRHRQSTSSSIQIVQSLF